MYSDRRLAYLFQVHYYNERYYLPQNLVLLETFEIFSAHFEAKAYKINPVILLSAGIDSTFFLVAGTVPCFGFRMRTLLITPNVLAVAEWCLHRAKDISASHKALPHGAEGAQGVGRDRTRTADLNWTKGFLIPHGITLNNKSWGSWGLHCLGTGWALVSRYTVHH